MMTAAAPWTSSIYSVGIMQPRANFALFHEGALGDFVIIFPIFRSLASRPLSLVTATSKGHLASHLFGHVRPVSGDQDHFIHLFSPEGTPPDRSRLEQDLGHPGWIISFVSRPDDPWARQMARALPDAHLVCVEPRPPEGWVGHVTGWHAHQIRTGGLGMEIVPHGSVRPLTDPGSVLVHVGSGGRIKCWPQERWIALITTLRESGYRVEVVYGEAEHDRWSTWQRHKWRDQGAVFLESLEDLYAWISRCGMFIGHDTGPSHLAAQMGVRTIVLFGPTCPRLWAPQGPAVKVLAPAVSSSMTWLSVEDVVAAASEPWHITAG